MFDKLVELLGLQGQIMGLKTLISLLYNIFSNRRITVFCMVNYAQTSVLRPGGGTLRKGRIDWWIRLVMLMSYIVSVSSFALCKCCGVNFTYKRGISVIELMQELNLFVSTR